MIKPLLEIRPRSEGRRKSSDRATDLDELGVALHHRGLPVGSDRHSYGKCGLEGAELSSLQVGWVPRDRDTRDKPSFQVHQSARIGPSPVEGTPEAGCITLVEPPWGEEIIHLLLGSEVFLSYGMFSVARHRRLWPGLGI